ncbi:hypothetical protein B0H11DRAFT_2235977 [Mycena galericulata]|nr:hypothetical protein B0H11DRAFT_2235977 [Mycena galericulata]
MELTPSPPPPAKLQQRTLFQFGAKKLGPAEAESRRKRHAAEAREKCLAATEAEKMQKVLAVERQKDNNRERQQRWRDRKKLTGDSVAKKAKTAILIAEPKPASTLNVAEMSRPKGMNWKGERTGTENGVIQKRHQRVNWYHPFL